MTDCTCKGNLLEEIFADLTDFTCKGNLNEEIVVWTMFCNTIATVIQCHDCILAHHRIGEDRIGKSWTKFRKVFCWGEGIGDEGVGGWVRDRK